MSQCVQLRLLRLLLLFSGFAWGISVVGVFVSWPEANQLLQDLGAKSIAYDPMLDYWLRMASGAFALVGVLFIWFAFQPRKYAVVLPLFGLLMIGEGMVLMLHGWRLHLPPFPYLADFTACWFAGAGILWLKNSARA
jgi:hypothetical protein